VGIEGVFVWVECKMAKKSGQLPTFKNKSGQQKSPKILGFLALCPLAHLFS
jgi:hypothetical protein